MRMSQIRIDFLESLGWIGMTTSVYSTRMYSPLKLLKKADNPQ